MIFRRTCWFDDVYPFYSSYALCYLDHFYLPLSESVTVITVTVITLPPPPPTHTLPRTHTHTHSSLCLRWTPVLRSLIASHPPPSNKLSRRSVQERKEQKALTPSPLKRAKKSQLVVVLSAVVLSARVRSVLIDVGVWLF